MTSRVKCIQDRKFAFLNQVTRPDYRSLPATTVNSSAETSPTATVTKRSTVEYHRNYSNPGAAPIATPEDEEEEFEVKSEPILSILMSASQKTITFEMNPDVEEPESEVRPTSEAVGAPEFTSEALKYQETEEKPPKSTSEALNLEESHEKPSESTARISKSDEKNSESTSEALKSEATAKKSEKSSSESSKPSESSSGISKSDEKPSESTPEALTSEKEPSESTPEALKPSESSSRISKSEEKPSESTPEVLKPSESSSRISKSDEKSSESEETDKKPPESISRSSKSDSEDPKPSESSPEARLESPIEEEIRKMTESFGAPTQAVLERLDEDTVDETEEDDEEYDDGEIVIKLDQEMVFGWKSSKPVPSEKPTTLQLNLCCRKLSESLSGNVEEDEEEEEESEMLLKTPPNSDESLLQQSLLQLQKQLRKSDVKCSRLEKICQFQQKDIDSLRFEMDWKDKRIEYLQKTLEEMESKMHKNS